MGMRIGHGPEISQCEWPESVTRMQGRNVRSGIPAFVEVSVHDGNVNTFIRRDSDDSVFAAEIAAFEAYRTYAACPGHAFERREWRNGAGVCERCKMWSPNVFEPLERCQECGAATYYSSFEGRFWCEMHDSLRPRRPFEFDPADVDDSSYSSAEFEEALSTILVAIASKGKE